MSTGLLDQLDTYFSDVDAAQGRVTPEQVADRLDQVRELPRAGVPVRQRPRIWVAVAAAAAAMLLTVGAASLLFRGDGGSVPPATEPAVSTSTAASTSTTIGEATSPPDFDVDSIPLPVIAEEVTPSSIGVATWTVYEGLWTNELEAGLWAVADSTRADEQALPEPVLPQSIFSADGIVVDANANYLGAVDGVALHNWLFRVDWVETVVLHGEEEFRVAADDGLIGEVVGREPGSVDVLLFASEDEKRDYLRAIIEGFPVPGDIPFETIAEYRFSAVETEGRWTFEATDTATGERLGSVTSALPITNSQYPEGVITLSGDESVELVEPDWLEAAALHGFNWFHIDVPDAFVVYAERNGSTYEAWRSIDGRTWENLGSTLPEGYFPQQVVGNSDEGWTAYLDDATESNAPGPDFMHAFSDDGLNWIIRDELPEICGEIYRLAAGWVCTSSPVDQFTLDVWTSPDGTAWEEIATAGLPPMSDLEGSGGGTSVQVGDDTIVIQVTTDAQPETRVWVIQFG
jgi:hypothetical protein